jgi:hypothetical protein
MFRISSWFESAFLTGGLQVVLELLVSLIVCTGTAMPIKAREQTGSRPAGSNPQ